MLNARLFFQYLFLKNSNCWRYIDYYCRGLFVVLIDGVEGSEGGAMLVDPVTLGDSELPGRVYIVGHSPNESFSNPHQRHSPIRRNGVVALKGVRELSIWSLRHSHKFSNVFDIKLQMSV